VRAITLRWQIARACVSIVALLALFFGPDNLQPLAALVVGYCGGFSQGERQARRFLK